jgi:hypothetical protein
MLVPPIPGAERDRLTDAGGAAGDPRRPRMNPSLLPLLLWSPERPIYRAVASISSSSRPGDRRPASRSTALRFQDHGHARSATPRLIRFPSSARLLRSGCKRFPHVGGGHRCSEQPNAGCVEKSVRDGCGDGRGGRLSGSTRRLIDALNDDRRDLCVPIIRFGTVSQLRVC